MPRILEIQSQVTLYSADSYPRSTDEAQRMGLSGDRNAEVRAMTIAAFRIAQNNTQLSQQQMNSALLKFLIANSNSADSHWRRKGWLVRGEQAYQLTPTGITECQNSLLGLVGSYSTTEEKVQEWLDRMLVGDGVAARRLAFPPTSWFAA